MNNHQYPPDSTGTATTITSALPRSPNRCGGPQMSVAQGPRRLRQHDEVRWPAAPSNGAAAAVEEGDVHAMFLSHLYRWGSWYGS